MAARGIATMLLAAVVLLTMLYPSPKVLGDDGDRTLTRAEGEDLTVLMNLSFNGPLDYTVRVTVEVYSLYFREDLYNSSALRSIVASEGQSAGSELASELMGRCHRLASISFSGDDIMNGSCSLPLEGLATGGGDEERPVLFDGLLHGRVRIDRLVPSKVSEGVLEDYQGELVCGLLLSGFRFQRTFSFRSEPGVTVTYVLPTTISPYDDGAVTLNVRNTRVPPVAGYNPLTIDGRVGIYTGPFDLQLTGHPPLKFDSENMSADTVLDWGSLEALDIRAELEIMALATERLDLSQLLLSSITAPNFVGAGLVRLCFLDGLLGEEHRALLEGEISSEFASSLEAASGQTGLETVTQLDTNTASLHHPTTGSSLISLLMSAEPLKAAISLKAPIGLDILDGHSPDDIMGLLNGGLRVLRDFEPVNDDRTGIEIVMPNNLTFHGETPKRTRPDGRRVFDYEAGYRSISSISTPAYTSEIIALDIVIDISEVRSDYFLDVEVLTSCDIDIDVSTMEFRPDEFELNTTIEFELDHLSSDMVRLLIRMGVIDREALEVRLSDEISELLDPFIGDEDQTMELTIDDQDLLFDGDISSMDGSRPIHIDAHVEGLSEPFGPADGGDGTGASNVFVHRHWKPLVPFRTVKRTVAFEGSREWDTSIKVIFPSGCGVKAWLVNGSQRLEGGTEVKVEGAYPTLVIEGNGEEWDRIELEISMAGWFGFNNVLFCFATTIGSLIIVLLIVLVCILRRVRMSMKKGKEEKAQTGQTDREYDFGSLAQKGPGAGAPSDSGGRPGLGR